MKYFVESCPVRKLETASFDGVYTSYVYCADPNGWKFAANNDWAINLGSNNSGTKIDNLVGDGKDLTVVGSTIKLYPTRKTADQIYCIVE